MSLSGLRLQFNNRSWIFKMLISFNAIFMILCCLMKIRLFNKPNLLDHQVILIQQLKKRALEVSMCFTILRNLILNQKETADTILK